jgi:hypothetical protein
MLTYIKLDSDIAIIRSFCLIVKHNSLLATQFPA